MSRSLIDTGERGKKHILFGYYGIVFIGIY